MLASVKVICLLLNKPYGIREKESTFYLDFRTSPARCAYEVAHEQQQPLNQLTQTVVQPVSCVTFRLMIWTKHTSWYASLRSTFTIEVSIGNGNSRFQFSHGNPWEWEKTRCSSRTGIKVIIATRWWEKIGIKNPSNPADLYTARFSALRTQREVQKTPRKRNKTCSNLTQATQEVANDMAGICHVIRCVRFNCVGLETGL